MTQLINKSTRTDRPSKLFVSSKQSRFAGDDKLITAWYNNINGNDNVPSKFIANLVIILQNYFVTSGKRSI